MSELSTRLYNTLTQPETMRQLLANFFADSKDQAIALLQKSGVAISSSATMKQVQLAWLAAIKDSASFRQQAANTLTGYVGTLQKKVTGNSNFIGNSGVQYYNDVTDVFGGTIDPNSYAVTVNPADANAAINAGSSDSTPDQTAQLFAPLSPTSVAATVPPVGAISNNPNAVSSTITPPAASASGSIWSSLGALFTPKTIGTAITTGLQAYSTNMTAKANQTSAQQALSIEQAKLAQAQLAAQNPTGLSTGWIIALVIAGMGTLIAAAAIIAHKKAKR